MDVEISQNHKENIEELVQMSQNMNESEFESTIAKKKFVSAFVIKIFKQINKLSEEMFLEENPNWIAERRTLLKDNKKLEYNSYCQNVLANKIRIESQAADMILQKLD